MLDRAREHPRARAQRGGQDVDRLRRVANEDDGVIGAAADKLGATVSPASSNAAVATWDLNPVPRWTLLYQGINASTASPTAAITGVLAA